MRGAQKAQPFVHPLDGRVRALVTEAHGGRTLNGSWLRHVTSQRGIEVCKAGMAFAVHGSLKAYGVEAKRRATHSQNTNCLTIRVREAQAIDRLNKEREAPFTD